MRKVSRLQAHATDGGESSDEQQGRHFSSIAFSVSDAGTVLGNLTGPLGQYWFSSIWGPAGSLGRSLQGEIVDSVLDTYFCSFKSCVHVVCPELGFNANVAAVQIN